ncbi:SIS domain-containing protein [Rathayibacter sp. VKM Ac-2835]|uniref:SIS domain-containing protein n=1 Tax=Rathayibacter sp. VKM Ac-2835 TaxID=2739043 RepID=UPI0015639F57|nr:SIS domain-containing protein [Rathayibacter sp. VKM Ac-2835]NRG43055.1 SIS domain-containing protein [Rathayibacter sp. VKM Ac-2835]
MTDRLLPSPVLAEIEQALAGVDDEEYATLSRELLTTPRRWFFSGMGRSGRVASMSAMRLMHLGFDSFTVGESTTPALEAGDGLVVFTASGTTASVLAHVELAKRLDAVVVAITRSYDNPVARLADTVVIIPNGQSEQFAGSLFEQTSLILFDSIIHDAIQRDATLLTIMHSRHANLQ